uniref:Putative secreted protein n=1 Tax=Anopheles darlingi TaxID=43151 RepID=A0A2M4DJ31_ANODA
MSFRSAVAMISGISLCSFSTPSPPTTSERPCAAPDRSTLLDSDVSVCINHGSRSSNDDSPIPRTIAPSARADTARTSGTGSSRDVFKPGMMFGR